MNPDGWVVIVQLQPIAHASILFFAEFTDKHRPWQPSSGRRTDDSARRSQDSGIGRCNTQSTRSSLSPVQKQPSIGMYSFSARDLIFDFSTAGATLALGPWRAPKGS